MKKIIIDELLKRSTEDWVSNYGINKVKEDIEVMQNAIQEFKQSEKKLKKENQLLISSMQNNVSLYNATPSIINGVIYAYEMEKEREELKKHVQKHHDSLLSSLSQDANKNILLRLTEDEFSFKSTTSNKFCKLEFKNIGERILFNGIFEIYPNAETFISVQQVFDKTITANILKVMTKPYEVLHIRIIDNEEKSHTISFRNVDGVILLVLNIGMIPYPTGNDKNMNFNFQNTLPIHFEEYFKSIVQ